MEFLPLLVNSPVNLQFDPAMSREKPPCVDHCPKGFSHGCSTSCSIVYPRVSTIKSHQIPQNPTTSPRNPIKSHKIPLKSNKIQWKYHEHQFYPHYWLVKANCRARTPKRTEFPRRIRSVSSPTRHGAARVHRAPTMRRRRSRGRPGPGQRCVPGGPVRPDSKTWQGPGLMRGKGWCMCNLYLYIYYVIIICYILLYR